MKGKEFEEFQEFKEFKELQEFKKRTEFKELGGRICASLITPIVPLKPAAP
jgi:hypothetical protein